MVFTFKRDVPNLKIFQFLSNLKLPFPILLPDSRYRLNNLGKKCFTDDTFPNSLDDARFANFAGF